MAGISLTLEGSNIQLSFQKGEQTTAVLMDQRTAQGLFQALGQMLSAMGGEGDEIEGELVDVTSPSIDIGLDEAGQAVLALQAGPLPPFMLRLKASLTLGRAGLPFPVRGISSSPSSRRSGCATACGSSRPGCPASRG